MKRLFLVLSILNTLVPSATRAADPTTPIGAVRGKGCSTQYYIDADCDGAGVAKRSNGYYGPPLVPGSTFDTPLYGDQPDADDNDATVSTVADWRAKYGSGASDSSIATLLAFLSASRGYSSITRIAVVDPVNGNNATANYWDTGSHSGADPFANPYQSDAYIGQRLFADGNGGLIIFRGGAYTGHYLGNDGTSSWSVRATSGHRLYLLAYPGERVVWNYAGGISENLSGTQAGYVTVDGFIFQSSNPNFGGAIGYTEVAGLEVRNCEFLHQGDAMSAHNRVRDAVIEKNVFHDIYHHSLYLGYSDNAQGLMDADFDFTAAETRYQATSALCYNTSGGATTCKGAADNVKFQDNVLYRSGYGGYEPIHMNAYAKNVLVTRNIVHNTGGTGVGFQTGIYDSEISNNQIYMNGLCGITINLYGPDWQAASMRRLKVVNNSIFVGAPSDSIRGGSPSCGLLVSGSDQTAPGHHWIKDLTFANNLVMTHSQSVPALNFYQDADTSTFSARNNLIFNLHGGSPSDSVMKISADYPYNSPGTWSYYTWAQFLTFNAGWTGNSDADPKITAYPVSLSAAYPDQIDLTLQATSPAINAAISASAPSVDARGITRTTPDVGALEFSAGISAGTCSMVSGNSQSGVAGQVLGAPFIIKVTNSNGLPMSGVGVTFAVTAGVGTLSVASVATDSAGLASSTLTLGPNPGVNTVTVSSGSLIGSPVIFNATGQAQSAASIVLVSGNSQSGIAGQALSSPFVVKVTDAKGNPVAGFGITFAVTAGGGTLSATAVVTDSAGLASSTLTLGPSAGTNTVTASAGVLSGGPITFSASASPSNNPTTADITWTLQSRTAGWPGYNGWQTLWYDPLSQSTVLYGIVNGSKSIYSTDIFFYKSLGNTFAHLGGTGSMEGICTGDTDSWPGDRHPGWMMSADTKRNALWLYGGVNAGCNGGYITTSGVNVTRVATGYSFPVDGSWNGVKLTIGANTYVIDHVVDSDHLVLTTSAGVQATQVLYSMISPNVSPRQDMYYLEFNANPLLSKWHRVIPPHIPGAAVLAAMAYDPDDDALFVYGSAGGSGQYNNWVYCPSSGNPTPGMLTAKQAATGCAAADDWTLVSVSGNVQPPGAAYAGMVYDTVTKKVILFGGMDSGLNTSYNQTWAYDLPTKTWIRKGLSTVAPPVYSGSWVPQPAMAYIPTTHKIIYHQTSNLGAPADWQYDPVADTWTKLVSAGGGAGIDQILSYDASTNRLVGFNQDPSSGAAAVWQATLSATPAAPRSCDLNADGQTNAADAQLAVQQALGLDACGRGDVNGDGQCNVVDIQRVIAASLGGGCQTGQ